MANDFGFLSTNPADGARPRDGASNYNQWADIKPTNYQQYVQKMQASKLDPTSAWLTSGYSPLSEADWVAQNARAASGPTSFGGGAGAPAQNLGLGGGGGYDRLQQPPQTTQPPAGNSGTGENPYLQDMGKNIMHQMTENYNRNQLPAMRSGAMAAGGFGGSRHGVVEASGLRDLNLGIGQNMISLFGQDWTNGQNRNLQQQSINNSRDLGFANIDSNNQQFGANYGLNVMNAQNNWANQGVQTANQMQNTPIDYSRYFNGQANTTAGQGGTNTASQTNPGNPWIGALGGAQLANKWLTS